MHHTADILVIGGGAAGVTFALELQRQGLHTMRDVVALDAQDGPGGTWRHAVPELPLRLAAGLAEPVGLADFGLSYTDASPDAPARDVVPRTMAYFEDATNVYVYRPARVTSVTSQRRSPLLRATYEGPQGRTGTVDCRIVVDASGYWSSPFVPWVPRMLDFEGEHVTAPGLTRLDALRDARVLVVGQGPTAAAFVALVRDRAAAVAWTGGSDVAPPRSPRSPRVTSTKHQRARSHGPTFEAGAAFAAAYPHRRGALRSFTARGAVFSDGTSFAADIVLWATGTHLPTRHLAPLKLRDAGGLLRSKDGWSRRDPRVAFVSDGPGGSGATAVARASAVAAEAVDRLESLLRQLR